MEQIRNAGEATQRTVMVSKDTTKPEELAGRTFLESLILAQDERWRRA